MLLRKRNLLRAIFALGALNLFVLIWLAITSGNQMGESEHYFIPSGIQELRLTHEPKTETSESRPTAATQLEAGMGTESRSSMQERLDARIKKLQNKSVVETKACYEIGPLYNESDVKKLSKSLLEIDIKSNSRVVEPSDFMGYWVYLAPEKSFNLARLKIEELKRKGLQDVAIVRKENPRNSISLGIFKHEEIAQQRFNEVEQKGYKPKLVKRFRDRRRTYVKIKVAQSRFLSQERWSKILSKYTKNAELIPVDCPEEESQQAESEG